MKLNWFSPLPPAKSGIAEYAAQVLPCLQSQAEVVIWTDQSELSSELKHLPVRKFEVSNPPWAEFNQADLNIYHLGNNCKFHSTIWQLSRKCPGLVVLHDLRLQHFFAEFYLSEQRNRPAYVACMEQLYGIEGKQAAEQFLAGAWPINELASSYPLTPLALENAIGVVVHTQEAFRELGTHNRWFVGHAPLPYIKKLQPKSINKKNSPPYRLVVFGYISPNRCLEAVLEAIANLPEKDLFHLDVYGQVWDNNYIRNQISNLKIANLVTLHGFVNDAKLDKALANADLAINLRNPTMGEASLSQLRIWSHGLPSVVTRIGWYAELPEDAVVFVNPDREVEDLQQHFRRFLTAPDEFVKLGQRGYQILEDHHTPEMYARSIVAYAESTQKLLPYSSAQKIIASISSPISVWRGESQLEDSELRAIAEAIHFICK